MLASRFPLLASLLVVHCHNAAMPDRVLGPIVRLQVQCDPLKNRGFGYDPSPIAEVEEASLDGAGMVGRRDGAWMLDVHHPAHPRARAGGRRALSIGFTSHYAAIADHFGRGEVGCAGENIIVDTPGRVTQDDLAGEILVRAADGDVVLRGARVASPCAEFTSWLKGLDVVLPKQDQPDDVAFLDDGMRGYILSVDHLEGPMKVRVGDRVSVRT